jgi:two-component system, NarL family, nitrate/nitrite response regulator NarL
MRCTSQTTMERTKLLLLIDFVLVRESLSRQLALEPDLQVVAEGGTPAEGLEALRHSPADVVLLDLDPASDGAAQFISSARQTGYAGKILVIASGTVAQRLLPPLRAGASGIFLKHNSYDSLLSAVRLLANGQAWVDPAVMQLLAESIVDRETPDLRRLLTERELKILNGVIDGLSNKNIAGRIGASEGAVKAVLRQIFEKAGVRTRSQLVRVALSGSTRVAMK